ncbi:10517_t:CDS:1, partial [Dentiscutata heterogama]
DLYNILQQDINNAYVVDLEFLSSIKSKVKGIYSALSYVMPEVLSHKLLFIQISNIYFIIEISVGQRPFDNIPFDEGLDTSICLGF